MDVFRFTEIAEAGTAILNPFTDDQLALLGRLCRLHRDQTILDLGCGKGELLCCWSRDHQVRGVGVDIHEPLIAAANRRALELGVANHVEFVVGDGATYDARDHRFDVVTCIGAAWIGGSLADTLRLMQRHTVEGDPLLVVGEPFYTDEPNGEASHSLAELADLFSELGLDLVEMIVASREGWDRYIARKWWAAERWLRHHPDSDEAPLVRERLDRGRRDFLHGGRLVREWGVFVLRVR